MNPLEQDTLAVIVAVLAVGLGLWRLIAHDIREVRRDLGDLREHMARLEGMFEAHLATAHTHPTHQEAKGA